jgi:hypothetical protein
MRAGATIQMRSDVAVLAQDAESWRKALLLEPGIHAATTTSDPDGRSVRFTTAVDMVYTQEHRLRFSAAGTDVATIDTKHLVLDGLVTISLPLGVFGMGLAPFMFTLLALFALPVAIAHFVLSAPKANRPCLPLVLHPLQRHMLLFPAWRTDEVALIVPNPSAANTSTFLLPLADEPPRLLGLRFFRHGSLLVSQDSTTRPICLSIRILGKPVPGEARRTSMLGQQRLLYVIRIKLGLVGFEDQHSRLPHCSAIALAIPTNVRLLFFHLFSLGGS